MLRLCAAVILFSALAAPPTLAAQRGDGQPPADTESGRDTYYFHCAPCHGVDGRGDGPVVSALKAAAPDLRTLARRRGGRFPKAAITTFVTGKGRSSPAHGSRDMPIWGPLFREMNPFDSRIDVRLNRLIDHLESIQIK